MRQHRAGIYHQEERGTRQHVGYRLAVLLPESRTMSSSQDLVTTLKAELKRAGVTYAHLAREMGLAESSVKRIFSLDSSSASILSMPAR